MKLATQSPLVEKCLRCSRKLTNPVSMYVGFGPICSGHLGIERPEYDELIALNPELPEHLEKLRQIRQTLEARNNEEKNKEGSVTLEDDTITIKFKWGCQNFDKIKDTVKSCQARWNPSEKQWTADKSRGRELAEALQQFQNLTIDEGLFDLPKNDLPKNDLPEKPGVCRLTDDKKMLAISFDIGNPNFHEMKDTVKHLKARWQPENKVWTYPLNFENTAKIISLLKDYGVEIDSEIEATIATLTAKQEQTLKMSAATDADITIPGLNGSLYPFQKAGVLYAIEKERVLIADEMGLGKTVQAIAWLQASHLFPAVIIVPASLKLNWENEINHWLPDKKIVVLSGMGKNGDTHAETYAIQNSDITILNYDILANREGQLKQGGFRAVILDESHYIKNRKAIRTKAVMELRKTIPFRMCLTGTPVLNRPNELIQPLSFLNCLNELGGFWGFVKRYCAAKQTSFGWDMSGASNLKELNQKLRETCMVRRQKADVLTELPAKQRVFIPVELDLTHRAKYNDAVENFFFWIEELRAKKLQEKAKTVPPGTVLETTWLTQPQYNPSYPEQLVKIEILKQLAAKGKLATVKEWVADFLETGEKLVVFAHHKEIIADLAKHFAGKCTILVGDTLMQERQAAVDKFQSDPNCQLFIGSTKAAGVGITLTAASNVAFVELGWTPADHDQAEDRCHRIGQENSVTAWYFIAEETIEDDIRDLILSKRGVVNLATDGTDKTNVTEKLMDSIVEKLLGKEDGR